VAFSCYYLNIFYNLCMHKLLKEIQNELKNLIGRPMEFAANLESTGETSSSVSAVL
jgi:hypothetical protein